MNTCEVMKAKSIKGWSDNLEMDARQVGMETTHPLGLYVAWVSLLGGSLIFSSVEME